MIILPNKESLGQRLANAPDTLNEKAKALDSFFEHVKKHTQEQVELHNPLAAIAFNDNANDEHLPLLAHFNVNSWQNNTPEFYEENDEAFPAWQKFNQWLEAEELSVSWELNNSDGMYYLNLQPCLKRTTPTTGA